MDEQPRNSPVLQPSESPRISPGSDHRHNAEHMTVTIAAPGTAVPSSQDAAMMMQHADSMTREVHDHPPSPFHLQQTDSSSAVLGTPGPMAGTGQQQALITEQPSDTPLPARPSKLPALASAPIPPKASDSISESDLRSGLRVTMMHAGGTNRMHKGSSLPQLKPGRHLYYSVQNNNSNAVRTSFKGLPPILKDGLVLFVQSEIEDHLLPSVEVAARGVVGPNAYARLYVLWPSSMERIPRWLRHNYTTLDTVAVTVSWHTSFVRRMLLTLGRKYEEFKHQQLIVYESKTVIEPGHAFTLLGAGAVGEPTDQPYVLAIKLSSTEKALIAEKSVNSNDARDPFRPSMDAGTEADGGAGFQPAPSQLLTPALLENINAAASNVQQAIIGRQGSVALAHLGRLLHSNNSSELTESLLGSDGKLNFADLPRIALAQRTLDNVKMLILLNVLSTSLKDRPLYEKFEQLAFRRRDAELLLILQYKSKQELSVRGLAFLLNYMWSMARRMPPCGLFIKAAGVMATADMIRNGIAPGLSTSMSQALGLSGLSLADEIQAFLLHYTATHRNPLSITSAILKGVDREIQENDECKYFMSIVSNRFQTLNMALLKQLGRLIGHVHSVALLHSVLDPRPREATAHVLHPTINDTSAVQVALDQSNLEFMVHPLVIEFTHRTWQGASYKAQTSCGDPRSISLLSPLIGWRLLKDAGFAGGAANIVIEHACKVWHTYAFTSQAFFNSPRGRWCMHAMCELFFLIIFQMSLFSRTEWYTARLLVVFLILVGGNLLEICQHVQHKHGSVFRISKYLMQDLWNTLNFVTNVGLGILLVMLSFRANEVQGSAFQDGYQQGSSLQLAFCTFAVFVWLRSLSMLVPVFPRLGPLLITVARMLNELIAFIIPLFVVMAGFATMMVGAYKERISDYRNFIQGLLTMFQSMLGQYSYLDFMTDEDGVELPQEQYLYGVIMLSIYIILTTVLLLNLLIAIITNRYRPDDLEAEMQMKTTRIVDYYHLQVQHNLVCSPFNLVQLMLSWLPALPRPKNRPSRANIWGLVALDGPSTAGDYQPYLKTGWAEVPHLFFLLTLYPGMALFSTVCFYAFTPFAILRFAGKMFKRLLQMKKKNKVSPDDLLVPAAVAEGAEAWWSQDKEEPLPSEPSKDHTAVRISGRHCLKQSQLHSTSAKTTVPPAECWTVPAVRDRGQKGGNGRAGPIAEGAAPVDTPFRITTPDPDPHVDPEPLLAEQDVRSSAAERQAAATLYRNMSSMLETLPPAARGGSRLDKLEQTLINTSKSGMTFLQGVVFWASSWVLVLIGALVYVLLIGVCICTLWTTLYIWLGKVIFSLNNIFIAPWIQLAQSFIGPRRDAKQDLASDKHSPPSQIAEQELKKAAVRSKWQTAAAKAVQATTTTASADQVMRPKDLAVAISNSKFARLVQKWGCTHLLEPLDSATSLGEGAEAAEDHAAEADDEDDDSPNQDVLDKLEELEKSHSVLVEEIQSLRRKMGTSAGHHVQISTA